MTIIQPHKSIPFIDKILALLIAALVIASLFLVIVYNKTVNLNHGVSELDLGVKKTQTDSAELKDKIFGIFDTASVGALAKERNLIKENNPRYIENGRTAEAAPSELAKR